MTGDEEPEWRTNRERVAYEEGCRVLEAQKSDINEMDDKALRTVRVTALLLGAGAAVARTTGTDRLDTAVTVASVSCFLLSLIFGVVVYNESKEVVGPTSEYLDRLRRDDVSADWEQDLLVQFDGWIEENQKIVEYNDYLLNTCQLFFVFGVALGTAALLSLDLPEALISIGAVMIVPVVVAPLLNRRAG